VVLPAKGSLRSPDAFTLRRSQILLASARNERPPAIAQQLGCASQTVNNTIRACNERGLAALQEGSHRNHTIHTSFDDAGLEQLQALAHRSPRNFGHPTSLWTLDLLAAESVRHGLTARRVSGELRPSSCSCTTEPRPDRSAGREGHSAAHGGIEGDGCWPGAVQPFPHPAPDPDQPQPPDSELHQPAPHGVEQPVAAAWRKSRNWLAPSSSRRSGWAIALLQRARSTYTPRGCRHPGSGNGPPHRRRCDCLRHA